MLPSAVIDWVRTQIMEAAMLLGGKFKQTQYLGSTKLFRRCRTKTNKFKSHMVINYISLHNGSYLEGKNKDNAFFKSANATFLSLKFHIFHGFHSI